MGAEFIDGVIASCISAWPDASVISNGCRKPKNHTNARKRAEKSQSLISRLLDGCGKEFENIELSLSATEDFLLSIQCKVYTCTCVHAELHTLSIACALIRTRLLVSIVCTTCEILLTACYVT